MIQPEWIAGNIYIRPHKLAAGERIAGHKHNFEHVSLVHRGAVHVRAVLPNGALLERDFIAPAHFLVRPDVEHEITALEDTDFWCMYSHRDPQGRVTQEYDGWTPAYE